MAVIVREQLRPNYGIGEMMWYSHADMLRPTPPFPALCDGEYPLPIDIKKTVWQKDDFHQEGYLPESKVPRADVSALELHDPLLFSIHAGLQMLGYDSVSLAETLTVMEHFGYRPYQETVDFSLTALVYAYFGVTGVHEEIVRHPLDLMLRSDEFAFTPITMPTVGGMYTSRQVIVLPSTELRSLGEMRIADPLFREGLESDDQVVHTMGLLTVKTSAVDKSFFQIHFADPRHDNNIFTHAYLSYGHMLCCVR